jgi:hypothetical protein
MGYDKGKGRAKEKAEHEKSGNFGLSKPTTESYETEVKSQRRFGYQRRAVHSRHMMGTDNRLLGTSVQWTLLKTISVWSLRSESIEFKNERGSRSLGRNTQQCIGNVLVLL